MVLSYPTIVMGAPKLINSNYGVAYKDEVQEFYDSFSYSDSFDLRTNMINAGWIEKRLNVWDTKTFGAQSNCSVSYINDGNGGAALKITRSSCLPHAETPQYNFNGGSLKCSMRIKIIQDNITDEITASYPLVIGSSYEGKFLYIQNGKMILRTDKVHSEASYIKNQWYTIEWTLFKNSNKNTVFSCAVYDSKANKILSLSKEFNSAKGQIYIGEGCPDAEYIYAIDDVKIVSIGKEIIYNTQSGSKVWSTLPTIDLTFNDVVLGKPVLKNVNGAEIPATVSGTGTSVISVTPADCLNYGASYSIDISKITDASDAALDAASPDTVNFQVMNYSVGTIKADTPQYYSDSSMKIKVTFTNDNVKRLSAKVYAALYNGNAPVWIGYNDIKDIPIGEAELEFKKLPQNAENLKLKLFVWDNSQSLKPLYVQQ